MALDDILLEFEEHLEKSAEHLKHEMRGIRTGRASPALVENLKVMYYEQLTDLKAIAMIAVPEATQILIKPFAQSDLKAIEKAVSDSKLGLTAQSDGKQLRLKLPPLSQERRQQLVGQCKTHLEAAKVQIRNARRDANKMVETEEKEGTLNEDEAKKGKEQIQELLKTYEAKLDEMIENKRKEIMDV
jgi:ribosome recycling factor